MWWEEEGKHAAENEERDRNDALEAADAYAEELGELDDEQLTELLADTDYLTRWPRAKPLIEWEIRHRREA